MTSDSKMVDYIGTWSAVRPGGTLPKSFRSVHPLAKEPIECVLKRRPIMKSGLTISHGTTVDQSRWSNSSLSPQLELLYLKPAWLPTPLETKMPKRWLLEVDKVNEQDHLKGWSLSQINALTWNNDDSYYKKCDLVASLCCSPFVSLSLSCILFESCFSQISVLELPLFQMQIDSLYQWLLPLHVLNFTLHPHSVRSSSPGADI